MDRGFWEEIMKARTLGFLFALFIAITAEGRNQSTLQEAIETSDSEAQKRHEAVQNQLPDNEVMGFYRSDWLDLRRRKQRALASSEIGIRFKKKVVR